MGLLKLNEWKYKKKTFRFYAFEQFFSIEHAYSNEKKRRKNGNEWEEKKIQWFEWGKKKKKIFIQEVIEIKKISIFDST